MTEKNIWENLNFSEIHTTSAYDLLVEQSDYLYKATQGILKMQVEAIDAWLDENPPRLAALYILYVVAPRLGNYRRRILTVLEYSEIGKFPVSIVSHIEGDVRLDNISENNFIDTIEEILSRPLVKNAVENLYKQSKETDG